MLISFLEDVFDEIFSNIQINFSAKAKFIYDLFKQRILLLKVFKFGIFFGIKKKIAIKCLKMTPRRRSPLDVNVKYRD